MIIIIGNTERQVWGGDTQQAQLVGRSFHVAMEQHGLIGQELEVVFHFAAIQPGEGVEPLQDDGQFGEQDIECMAAADVDLFMDQYLLISVLVVEGRVDKDIVSERAGSAVADGFHDAKTAVADHRPCIGLIAQDGDLQEEIGAEEHEAEQVAVKESVEEEQGYGFE